MPRKSAGILLYRLAGPGLEVLIVHPGGPFWQSKDEGAWSLPKGEYPAEEDPRQCALRELAEELGPASPALDPAGLIDLGEVRQAGGKLVRAWAAAGEFDPAELESNTFSARVGGGYRTFPEVDRAEWFDHETARRKLNPAQAAFVDRLLEALDPAERP